MVQDVGKKRKLSITEASSSISENGTAPITNPSPLPRLNLDILLYLIRFLDEDDRTANGLHLIQTCRSLYSAGIPILVRDSRLALDIYAGRARSHLSSFCDFFEFDSGSRCRYIRNLSIITSPNDWPRYDRKRYRGVLSRLGPVLAQCTNLRSIALGNNATLLCALIPNFRTVFASLSSLRYVEMHSLDNPGLLRYTNMAGKILRSICSPVVSVTVNNGTSTDPGCEEDVLEIDGALGHLSTSLEVMHVGHFVLEDHVVVVYPNMKVLVIEQTSISDIRTEHLVRRFPFLEHLSFGSLTDEENDMIMDLWEMELRNPLEDARTVNIFTQRQHCKWKSLDSVRGDICVLYGLALMCPVRQLILLSWFDGNPYDIPMWHSIMRDCTPTAINLGVDMSYFRPEQLELLVYPGTNNLTHLDLELAFFDAKFKEQVFITNLTALLQSVPLTYLDLKLTFEPPKRVHHFIHDIDMNTFSAQWLAHLPPLPFICNLATSIRTLRYLGVSKKLDLVALGVDTETVPKLSKTFWEITRTERDSGQTISLRQLSKEAKKDVKIREKMVDAECLKSARHD
ncbi:hypothetical protein K474DRAFT_1665171 [Panus rudis PR-1116 ss-1]|nr:hypothetical protein K474DRAFT_1665171 [Panus rudis PR-1116 ss-1]